MTETTPLQLSELSIHDRCDRCGAQAYVKVQLDGGGDLHFCKHHYNQHSDRLSGIAVRIVDESHRLMESSSA